MTATVLGAGLLGPCHADPAQWVVALADWNELIGSIDLRPAIPADHWTASLEGSVDPTFPVISAFLQPVGLSHLTASAIQLLASIRGRAEVVDTSIAVVRWVSTGCLGLGRWQALQTALVRVILESEAKRPVILGMAKDEDETITAIVLDELDGDIVEVEIDSDVSCLSSGAALLRALTPVTYWRTPDVAISIAVAQLSTPIRDRWLCLPQFGESLSRMTPDQREDTFRKCASLLLHPALRPKGVREHELRAGTGPSEAQRTSVHGGAYRASIRQRGAGWRVHYWRSGNVVTFSNVAVHAELTIFE